MSETTDRLDNLIVGGGSSIWTVTAREAAVIRVAIYRRQAQTSKRWKTKLRGNELYIRRIA